MSMEDSSSTDEDNHFLDAPEDFPFLDCTDCAAGSGIGSHFSPSQSASDPVSTMDSEIIESGPKSPPETVSSSGLRRRKSFAKHDCREPSIDASENTASCLSDDGRQGSVDDSLHLKKDEERNIVDLDPLENESASSGVLDGADKEKFAGFSATSSNRDNVDDSGGALASTTGAIDEDQSGFLFFLAGLLIKALGFQLNLMVSFVSLPFWLFYTSYMFILNPFATVHRARVCLLEKVSKAQSMVMEAVGPSMSEWLKENNTVLKFALRCGWGLLWSAYVCSVLVGLLITAFVGSGLIMRSLVEEPFHLEHPLNFDFTEVKPLAVVPITAAWRGGPCLDCGGSIQVGSLEKVRVISPNRKLRATVRLTLPESDYNKRLGMFQVRTEFLSASGKTLASLRRPCMLHFRSEPIRLMRTFFKIIPLVAGYLSESQTLNLKFRGFTEGDIPTAYMKVIIEQRAEFRPAGGIPEVYDAALLLESELPLLKSILWSWRKTLFVWLGMSFFMIELLFALICCHKVVMPSFGSQSATDQRNPR